MSASDMPISQHAAALRIIGATMSVPRSSACTGPTVVASSPVPSHALEITPVRTQRFSSMSWRRARSRPRYNWSLASGVRVDTIPARSGSLSIVARNARTSAGSGFQSTYSGGSNAGNRFTAEKIIAERLRRYRRKRRRDEGDRDSEHGDVATRARLHALGMPSVFSEGPLKSLHGRLANTIPIYESSSGVELALAEREAASPIESRPI